jgi:hypothetical protein
MARKIPSKDTVISTIKDVMSKRSIIYTLNELHLLVRQRLKKENSKYVISIDRLKKLVLQIPEIKIKTKNRRSRKKVLKICPVCKMHINKLFGKNVFGKSIHMGYKCKNCGYRTDLISLMPKEYVFLLKK